MIMNPFIHKVKGRMHTVVITPIIVTEPISMLVASAHNIGYCTISAYEIKTAL